MKNIFAIALLLLPLLASIGAPLAVRTDDLPHKDNWLGVYFRQGVEQLYVTRGTIKSQRVIAGPIASPSSTSLRDPSPLILDGKFFVAHTINGFNATNRFAIIRSDDLVNWSHHYFFDCSTLSNYFNNVAIAQVWGPKWFTYQNTNYIIVGVATNAAGTGMRSFLTSAIDATLTNWTSAKMLTNSLDVNQFDGVLVRSSTNFQCWTRVNAAYIQVHESDNLYTGWSTLKTGDWAGWGSTWEGMWVTRRPDGIWNAMISDGGNGYQYWVQTTNADDFTSFSQPVARTDSVHMMNGGLADLGARDVPAATTYSFANGYSATTGYRYFFGNAADPYQSATIGIKGGTSAWLALDGSSDSGIAFDPQATGRAWYLAGTYGVSASVAMTGLGGTKTVSFWGDVHATNNTLYTAGIQSTNIGSISTVAFSARGNPDNGVHFPSINEVSLVANGTQAVLANANDLYMVHDGFLSWVPAWGSPADVGLTRVAGGSVLSVNDGSTATNFRDIRARTVLATNITVTSAASITVTITSGSGSPESVVTAPVGSLYLRTDGSTSTTLYVKTSGAGNTGWTAK